jgi:purine nucleosidase
MKVHLDTDLGGDIDDLCALTMLLRWPGSLDLTSVTTVGDTRGRRAGYVRYVLDLAGRQDVQVAAGADTSGGYYRYTLGLPPEERYWPEPVPSLQTPAQEAVRLLKQSIERGATIIGIGPLTNLYLLERQYPGILAKTKLYLMGGYVYQPRSGYPAWGNDMDFNIQADVKSAQYVLQNSHPLLVPLTVTVETALRRIFLDDLRRAGTLGALIARQAEAFAEDEQMETRFGMTCSEVPRDIINFLHDPLACAVAVGWQEGIEIQELPLVVKEENGWLTERAHPSGASYRIVTRVNGARFSEFWFETVANL